MVGRLAARRHAILAAVAGVTLLGQGPSHFSGAPWKGPKAILAWIDGDVVAIRIWGGIFVALACLLIAALHSSREHLYRVVLGSLAFVWGALGTGFVRAGFLRNSSFFVSVLCVVAVFSILNTILALDTRTKDEP